MTGLMLAHAFTRALEDERNAMRAVRSLQLQRMEHDVRYMAAVAMLIECTKRVDDIRRRLNGPRVIAA